MRFKLIVFSVLITFFGLLIIYNVVNKPITIFKRGTHVGKIELAGKTLNEGLTLLNKRFNSPIYLNIESASRAVTLNEIGISYDENELIKTTKVCNFRNPQIFCQNTSNEPIESLDLISIDKPRLDKYLNDLETEMQFAAKNTVISFEDGSFRVPTKESKITLDRTLFTSKNSIINLIDNQSFKIKLNLNTQENKDLQYKQTLAMIENITAPLLIKYGRYPVYIPRATLKSFIKVENKDGISLGIISKEEISKYLESLKQKYIKDNIPVVETDSIYAIQRAILYRTTDYKVNTAVILPIEGKPKTNGESADVYLEVIKSQQRLYMFEHGKLTRTYIVSTGLTWETPAGEFKILGKQKMAISYFGNWYMPNYLPIGVINGQYRFGFHSIPYHIDANGNIYSRDENTMGSPATGGCIQLIPEDSLELYEWAKEGTPVFIYE